MEMEEGEKSQSAGRGEEEEDGGVGGERSAMTGLL